MRLANIQHLSYPYIQNYAVFMFTPRMVDDECSQPEQHPPLTFFQIFFKYHYHRLLSRNAACGVNRRNPG